MPRIVLFGIRCAFSEVVLDRLIRADRAPAALILPGPPSASTPIRVTPRRDLAARRAGDIAELAHARDVPVFVVGRRGVGRLGDLLSTLQPDVITVACFPWLIPRKVRELPRLAALNVHPSLLPKLRGPDPLFWTLRDGDGICGVSIHHLSGAFDAGPIAAQTAVPHDDAITEADLDRLLAGAGAELLVDAVSALANGNATSWEQDHERASLAPHPSAADFTIDTNRTARSAFNFVRGVVGRATPTRIDRGSRVVSVVEAIGYGPPGSAIVRTAEPDVDLVEFADGDLLLVRLAVSPS